MKPAVVAVAATLAVVGVAVGGYALLSDGADSDSATAGTTAVDPRCVDAGPAQADAGGAPGDELRAEATALCTQALEQGVVVTPEQPGPRDRITVAYALTEPLAAGESLRVSMVVRDERIIEGCTRLVAVEATESKGTVTLDPEQGDGELPAGKRRWCEGTGSISGVRSEGPRTVFMREGVGLR